MDTESDLKKVVEALQKTSKRRLQENVRLQKENEQLTRNIIAVREEFTKQVKELEEELETLKIKYDRLKNEKGSNPLGSGRKSMDDMWRAKIEDCWKSGMKDKEIYGWITCTDEKGDFHVLSESTYYRFKKKYYKAFKNDFDRNENE